MMKICAIGVPGPMSLQKPHIDVTQLSSLIAHYHVAVLAMPALTGADGNYPKLQFMCPSLTWQPGTVNWAGLMVN